MTAQQNISLMMALVLGVFVFHGSIQAQQPVPALPQVQPNPIRLAQPESVAHVQVHVLEIQNDRLADAEALVRAFVNDPEAHDAASTIFFLGKDQERAKHLISQLVDAKLARVLSRPQLITLAGKSAEIQVGQQVAAPSSDDRQQDQHLGLTFTCIPQRVSNPDRLRLSISCTQRSASDEENVVVEGKTYPVVNEQKLQTMIEAGSGETIVLRGPHEKMMVIVTPTWAPPMPTPVKQASYLPSPSDVQAAPPSPLNDLVRLRQSLKQVEGLVILKVRIQGDRVEAKLFIDDADRINEINQAISNQLRIEFNSAEITSPGTGCHLNLEGRIFNPAPSPTTRDESIRMLRQDVTAIRDQLRQLADQLQD